MKNSTKIMAAALIAFGVAGAAYAHQNGAMAGMGMQGMGMHGMGMGNQGAGPTGQRGMHDPSAGAGRLAALKTELKITAEQEPAWQKFEATVNQQTQARQAMRDGMHASMQDPKAAASMDHATQREAMGKVHAAQRSERDAARQALFATLSPEQKAMADQRLGGERRMGMGMGMGNAPGMGHATGQGKGAHQHTN